MPTHKIATLYQLWLTKGGWAKLNYALQQCYLLWEPICFEWKKVIPHSNPPKPWKIEKVTVSCVTYGVAWAIHYEGMVQGSFLPPTPLGRDLVYQDGWVNANLFDGTTSNFVGSLARWGECPLINEPQPFVSKGFVTLRGTFGLKYNFSFRNEFLNPGRFLHDFAWVLKESSFLVGWHLMFLVGINLVPFYNIKC